MSISHLFFYDKLTHLNSPMDSAFSTSKGSHNKILCFRAKSVGLDDLSLFKLKTT